MRFYQITTICCIVLAAGSCKFARKNEPPQTPSVINIQQPAMPDTKPLLNGDYAA